MTDNANAINNAKGWMAKINEMLAARSAAEDAGDEDARETAIVAIDESPLSIQVRGGWHSPGSAELSDPVEYEILLSTGGPALRIVGELGEHCEPENARLQWQDWFVPWTDHDTTDEEDEAILTFAQAFYFGE